MMMVTQGVNCPTRRPASTQPGFVTSKTLVTPSDDFVKALLLPHSRTPEGAAEQDDAGNTRSQLQHPHAGVLITL
jgi:hypothetical protein